MKFLDRISEWYLREYLDNAPDFFEQAKIRLVFTLCALVIVVVIPVSISLFISELYISFGFSLCIIISFFFILKFLKRKQDLRLAAIISVLIAFIVISADLLFAKTIGLVDLIWFIVLFMYTHFILGTKWVISVIGLSLTVILVYIMFFFYDNFHDENIYSAGQEVALAISVIFSFFLSFYITRQFIKTQKYAENKIRESYAELQKANKELESYSYSVSHDLRAPVRSIMGFSDLIEKKYSGQLENNAKELLKFINLNAKKMDNLIIDLLAFSKSGNQEIKIMQVNMVELVNSVIKDVKVSNPGSKARIAVNSLPDCEADPNLINQVLTNLISNAVKYSSKKEQPEIEIGSFPGDGATIYYIKDNGAGFDMKYSDKLFIAFQRLHVEFEGTGLGLAIVKEIIERHGGKVWTESRMNEGATFYFSIPKKIKNLASVS